MNLKPEEVFLAQGTLRPDLIESASHLASGKADVIKTHHNDTELIRKLRDEVPLDRWTGGPLDRWTGGPLDRWSSEQLSHPACLPPCRVKSSSL